MIQCVSMTSGAGQPGPGASPTVAPAPGAEGFRAVLATLQETGPGTPGKGGTAKGAPPVPGGTIPQEALTPAPAAVGGKTLAAQLPAPAAGDGLPSGSALTGGSAYPLSPGASSGAPAPERIPQGEAPVEMSGEAWDGLPLHAQPLCPGGQGPAAVRPRVTGPEKAPVPAGDGALPSRLAVLPVRCAVGEAATPATVEPASAAELPPAQAGLAATAPLAAGGPGATSDAYRLPEVAGTAAPIHPVPVYHPAAAPLPEAAGPAPGRHPAQAAAPPPPGAQLPDSAEPGGGAAATSSPAGNPCPPPVTAGRLAAEPRPEVSPVSTRFGSGAEPAEAARPEVPAAVAVEEAGRGGAPAPVLQELAPLVTERTPGPVEAGATRSEPPSSQLREAVFQQVVHAGRLAKSRGRDTVVLRLMPPELGEVTLRLIHGPEGVTARFVAGLPEARGIIEGNLVRLEQALAGQGLQLQQAGVYGEGRQPPAPRPRSAWGRGRGFKLDAAPVFAGSLTTAGLDMTV